MISTERKNNEDRISQTSACHAEQDRLRKLYPWAVAGRVSQNCKKFLQQVFPGIRFSVTLEKYTGGSNLNVRWDLGPSPAEVERAIRPFQAGRFNGLVDMYEYDGGPKRQAWATVMGDAKFLSASRTWLGAFAPLKTNSVERQLTEQLPRLAPQWFEGREKLDAWNEAFRIARHITRHTSFPAWFDGSTPWRLERVTDGDGKVVSGVSFEETWRIVLDETCAPVPAVPEVAGNSSVSVTENVAKNGVEIRFTSKPDSATLEALKQAGFHWSRFQNLWYARRSPETLAFAYALLQS